MSFNFRESLECLNRSHYYEEIAEKLLKKTVEELEERQIPVEDIDYLEIAAINTGLYCTIKSYYTCGNDHHNEICSVEMGCRLNYADAESVVSIIEKRLKEEEFLCVNQTCFKEKCIKVTL